MNKILVPIDFSPASTNACEYAASLALAFHAEINLLYVYKDPVPATEESIAWSGGNSELFQEKEEQLKKTIETLQVKHLVKISGNVVHGFKGKVIRDMAERSGADLIVMGMKAALRNRVAGTTVLKTIRKSSIPVLIVPEGFLFRPIKNIILAIDFDEWIDEKCLRLLFELVKKFDASLRVLHVEKPGASVQSSELSPKLQMDLVLSKLSYVYDKVKDEDVVHGINHYVSNRDADTLVMVAHHHNIVQRIFEEVHTRAMLLELKLPLLALKA